MNNELKLLRVFFNNPALEYGFQLRELSRKIKLSPPSVKKYLQEFEKQGLIITKKHRVNTFPLYYANRDNNNFLFLKKLDNVKQINESGLLNYLQDECLPDVIILFGSASRGEDVKGSDIDLFLQCKERKIKLESYELRLNRKINCFFSENFKRLSQELKNNILNGVILQGYLEVF